MSLRATCTAAMTLAFGLGVSLASCSGESPKPRHVLLITVDTLRADHLGCYGSRLGLTPRIDRLAAESLQFQAAYASAPFTMPAVASLMTGRYPQEIGVRSNLTPVPDAVPRLAQLLQAAGWQTGAVVSNVVLRPERGLAPGFDHYDAPLVRERAAGPTSEAAIELLDTLLGDGSEPFLLWVHYMDPHGPYEPPGHLRQHYLEREMQQPRGEEWLPIDALGMGGIPRYQVVEPSRQIGFYRAGYAGEVRYMDEQLGRLLDALAERDLLESSLILFTADHGESLGEDDYWFAHGEYLHEPSVRVPFLLRIPGRSSERRQDLVNLVDVLPTLAALFGLPLDGHQPGRDLLAPGAAEHEGVALLSTFRGAASTARVGLVKGEYKYVRTQTRQGRARVQLFRLPDEKQNLAEAEVTLRDALGRELDAQLEKIPQRFQPDPARLSESDRQQLRALGYLEER